MGPVTQQDPNYFIWEVPGRSVIVHIHLEVVDRLGAEVMRGFGAVPKRGAEVGGVLVGFIEPGEVTTIRIEDFEAVPCRYSRGPSYLFSEDESAAFGEAVGHWQDEQSRHKAVGYYRSHTREGLKLADEDLLLLDRYFPHDDQIAILIKPSATKVSMAGIFGRDKGTFTDDPPIEFPFRRREMTGQAPPPRQSLQERMEERRQERRQRRESTWGLGEPEGYETSVVLPEPGTRGEAEYRPFFQWTPLALLLLLVGLIAGFGAALRFAPLIPATPAATQFALNLSVTRTGDNLTVRWNRDATALFTAQRGVLEIEDGGFAKPVDLDTAHLRDGSVIYQNTSDAVHFRLTVFLDERLSVSEALDWRK